MAAPEQPDVWPLWGRVVAVAGFAAVLVVAAVLALSGREDGAGAAARVVLSVGIAGLALGGVNLLAARLAGRSTERFAESLTRLEQTPGAEPAQLAAARHARAELVAGDVEAARAALEQVPVGTGPAAAAVTQCRRTARSAARFHRRQQRVSR